MQFFFKLIYSHNNRIQLTARETGIIGILKMLQDVPLVDLGVTLLDETDLTWMESDLKPTWSRLYATNVTRLDLDQKQPTWTKSKPTLIAYQVCDRCSLLHQVNRRTCILPLPYNDDKETTGTQTNQWK